MNLGIIFKKHANMILTGVGVAGVFTTAAIASNDTKRYLKETSHFINDKMLAEEVIFSLSKKEKAKLLVKNYYPTGICIALTSAAIIFSHTISAKEIAALSAAATFAEKKLSKYRDKIKEKLGEEEEHNIYAEVSKEDWKVAPYLPEGSDKRYFYDTFTEKFFVAKPDRVKEAIYHLNRNFQLKNHVYFSEFYEFLGLKPTDLHKTIGWSDTYYIDLGLTPWVDIYTTEKTGSNGIKYIEIYYDLEPSLKAMEEWE